MDSSTFKADTQSPESQNDEEEPVRWHKSQSEEQSRENTEPTSHSPTVAPHYYSVMDDEGPDEVFIHPPFLPSRLDPEGGSTCEAQAEDSSVSLRSFDATAANANPERLDWPHGERQLMTSHSQVNEEMESSITTFGEVVRRNSSEAGQNLELLEVKQDCEEKEEETTAEKTEAQVVELKSLEDVDFEEPGLTRACLNLDKHVTEDNQSKMDGAIAKSPDNSDDSLSGDSTPKGYDWVKRTGVEDLEEAVSVENKELDVQEEEEATETIKDSRIATEILQGQDLLQRLQLVQQRQDLADICQTKLEGGLTGNAEREDPEIIQENQKREETVQETSVLTVTEHFEHCSIHKTNVISCNEEGNIRNFVNLTDEDNPESECTEKQNVRIDQPTKDWGSDDCPKAEGAVDEDQNCPEEDNGNNNVNERTYLPPLSPQQTDTEEPGTWFDENRIPFPLCHRLSAAETYMEKQFQEASQIKLDLQRAEEVFNLSDNPDILEIPFKTNITLEPFSPSDDPELKDEWHFSEQKMQKEISQEMQRELVLVNLGKIPGGYSKGESRHMKDTKLLFEAFQQDTMEGPTRIRKPQISLVKSPVYPSVLERTRSLEMFSHKMSPMLRTHSFRHMSSSEKEKHQETFRSQSPLLREKARLSPYPKHEKLPRKHQSMDSINTTSSTTSVNKGTNSKDEPVRQGSPLLKENPFFKLRPALSLQPEVEKDIREAKKREEELRKQRSLLYGETRQVSKEEWKSDAQLKTDSKQKTTGRLERVWPPPSKKDQAKAEQQEARVQRAPGHRAALWQRWESGLINGQTPGSSNNND